MIHRRRLALVSVLCASLSAHAAGALAAPGDITLLGQHPIPVAIRVTTVWGYSDTAAGRDYAIVGDWYGGFFIIDVTDPSNPFEAKRVTGVPGFDLKVYGHYVYTCDGNDTGVDSRVIDIANPIFPTIKPKAFASCHAISISPDGIMFAAYPGVTIYDLAGNPANPDSLYHIDNEGHDTARRANRLYDFNGGSLKIWDVSNPSQPVYLGGDDDPGIGYYNSGDESQDHHYLYVCDQYAITPTPDIVIYDVSNPASPVRVGNINDPTARANELYVDGDLMFVGYYTAGFKVFDISNPASPVLADEFDTSPYQTESGPDVYNGAYDAYPFATSGIVYVSDHPNGLYLFAVEGHTPTGVRGAPVIAALSQNFPNPFNPSTTIRFDLDSRQHAVLRVYDVRGALLRTLVDESLGAGPHQAVWDGKNDEGRAVASGVYYYRLDAGPASATRRMVLLK